MEPPNQEKLLHEHPLKNHVILKQVFGFLNYSATFQDWKNIRLVCKFWHDETLSQWRRTAVLSFVRDATIFDAPLPNKTTPGAFLNELQIPNSPVGQYKLRELPYQRYKFARIKIGKPAQSELGNAFWNIVGPSIRHLTLSNVRFSHLPEFNYVNLLEFFTEVTPNLETLQLVNINHVVLIRPIEGLFHPNITSLHWSNSKGVDLELSSFPNLQELFLTNCNDTMFKKMFGRDDTLYRPVCDWQQIQRKILENLTVKRLDLMESKMGDCQGINEVIYMTRLKSLEHFSVHLVTKIPHRYSTNDVKLLSKFILNHSQSLKILEVFTAIDKAPPEVCFLSTELPMLTELRLWGNVVNDLGFLRFTPNLKLLHLDLFGIEKKDKMVNEIKFNAREVYASGRVIVVNAGILRSTMECGELSGVVLSKLKYLQINCLFSPEDVQNLGEWMPNLKILKAALDSQTISAVCENWPELEQLVCLSGSTIFNENVTGKFKTNNIKALIDLQCLKGFEYNADCDTSTLTDECVVSGFLKMRELTRLQICVAPELPVPNFHFLFKFTSEAENMLSGRIQDVNICRNYFTNKAHKNWNCCKVAAYKEFISTFNAGHEHLDMNELFSDSSSSDSSNDDY